MGLTYLFIAHDLSVVRNISDRVAVMYWVKLLKLPTAMSFMPTRCILIPLRCCPQCLFPTRKSTAQIGTDEAERADPSRQRADRLEEILAAAYVALDDDPNADDEYEVRREQKVVDELELNAVSHGATAQRLGQNAGRG